MGTVTPTVEEYRAIIERIFQEWIEWPKITNWQVVPVMDYTNDQYLLVTEGYEGYKRIYSVLIHVDIINGKLWVQHDETETGIVTQLEEAGVPRDRIVLGFRAPERRKDTRFAVA